MAGGECVNSCAVRLKLIAGARGGGRIYGHPCELLLFNLPDLHTVIHLHIADGDKSKLIIRTTKERAGEA